MGLKKILKQLIPKTPPPPPPKQFVDTVLKPKPTPPLNVPYLLGYGFIGASAILLDGHRQFYHNMWKFWSLFNNNSRILQGKLQPGEVNWMERLFR
jgi:hypothetical protein